MKKLLPLLIALLIPIAGFAGGFEGKVTMKVNDPKNAQSAMIFSLKDGFSRIDIAGSKVPNAAVIFDAAKSEMTILMLDQKMYMTQAIPKAAVTTAATAMTPGTGSAGVEVTTAKEKVLGYDCVKYVVQAKDGTTEAWVTDQLGSFLGLGNPPTGGGRRGPGAGAPVAQGWEEALAGKGVFPLRVITTAGGKETFRMEATAVEKASLPESAFSAPADFQNLSAMLRGLGMPGGIPGMPGGVKLPGG